MTRDEGRAGGIPRQGRIGEFARRSLVRVLGMPEGFAVDPATLVTPRDINAVTKEAVLWSNPREVRNDLAIALYATSERTVTSAVWRDGSYDPDKTTLWRDRETVDEECGGAVLSFWPEGGIVRVRVGRVLFQIASLQNPRPASKQPSPDASLVTKAMAMRASRRVPAA